MEIKLELDTQKKRKGRRCHRLCLRSLPGLEQHRVPPARRSQRYRADHHHRDTLRPLPGAQIRLIRHEAQRDHPPFQGGQGCLSSH